MKPLFYSHTDKIEGLNFESTKRGFVAIGESDGTNDVHPLALALFTIRLALRLGIKLPTLEGAHSLPYSSGEYHQSHGHTLTPTMSSSSEKRSQEREGITSLDPVRLRESDNLLFDAPLMSLVVGRRIRFLRGWNRYDSCVKGFNALGLLVEHVLKEMNKLQRLTPEYLFKEKLNFLRTKAYRDEQSGEYTPYFSEEELSSFKEEELSEVTHLDLAIWKAYAQRPIFCSTSSNMGISLHQVMRDMQKSYMAVRDKQVPLLNENEGWLVIWCPDEQADFMNSEKTETLRALETEQPPLTTLHTYINRLQRDPGALKDALVDGGYFFPTNPQSKEEMQNLLFISLNNMAKERNTIPSEILKDPKVIQALESLDCKIQGDKVVVTQGVEGGLYGLMVPYLFMLEETLQLNDTKAVSTWNQASIGAALAATVLVDTYLRSPSRLDKAILSEINELCPSVSKYLKGNRLGKHVKTCIHGVFDLANLQSLAQLLGVVVERHLSGRGTALVGLGSSSYANGNRCYEILKQSMDHGGAFKGKETFHLVTHTLIPIAQALIYAEDLIRAISFEGFDQFNEEDKVTFIARHVVKSEPAGAAAVAGYLLARLDSDTLSFLEITYALKLAGFTKGNFLTFAGYADGKKGTDEFVQQAFEEGDYMGQLAANVLSVLDWDLEKLEDKVKKERIHSRLNYRLNFLDTDSFEALNPAINIYLTGDNTRQPMRNFIREMMTRTLAYRKMTESVLEEDMKIRQRTQAFDLVMAVKIFFSICSGCLNSAQKGVYQLKNSLVCFIVKRLVDKEMRHQHSEKLKFTRIKTDELCLKH